MFRCLAAHAAILNVAYAIGLSISVFVGALVVALAMGLAVNSLSGHVSAADTMLGVLAHCAQAAELVAVSLLPGVRVDLALYFFGDILAVGRGDLAVIWIGGALVIALMPWRWSAFLA